MLVKKRDNLSGSTTVSNTSCTGVLERAGLVLVQRTGRERWNHLNVLPIKHIHDRWIGDYARSAVGVLASLQATLETPD